MKTGKLLFLFVLFTIVLAACGGGGNGDAPVEVVKKVVGAMETLDMEKASEYFCAEQKEALDDTLQSGFAELEAEGLDVDELLEAFKLNMEDIKYDERSIEGDEAVVNVSGNMSLEFDSDKLKEFFKKVAEAEGQEISDQELDFVIGIFEAMSGQEVPLDGDVKLVKEEGEWRVCDDLAFLDSGELFDLPLP